MMQTRNAKKFALRRLLLAGCALAVATSTGCKSAAHLPGASMFGFNKTPSPETIAGEGPSFTYPAPPSQGSTPRTYDSNAAGVAGEVSIGNYAGTPSAPGGTTGQVAGAASTPAQANGYGAIAQNYGQPGAATTPQSYGIESTGGYDIGTYGSTGPAVASTQPAATTAAPTSNYGVPGPGVTTPATQPTTPPNYALPPTGYNGIASTPSSTAPSEGPGYTTPGSGYSIPGIGASDPQAYVAQQTDPSAIAPPPGFNIPPASGTQAAGAYGSVPQVSGGTAVPNYGAPATPPMNGYRPGSTAGATSYPSTPYTPSTGSMIR